MSSTSRMVWLMRCSWPRGEGLARERDVDALVGQRLGERGLRELGLAFVHELLELDAHQVAELADDGALLGRQRRDRAQDLGEAALATEITDARLLECRRFVGGGHRGERLGAQGGKLGMCLAELCELRVVHVVSFFVVCR